MPQKAFIQICPNDTPVKLCTANVLHAFERILVLVVPDKAEAAICFLEAIQAHDEALDLAAFQEEHVDLLFSGVEGQVAHIWALTCNDASPNVC